MTSPGPSVIKDTHRGWWGIHYDQRGVERTRQSFRSREDARAWVKAQKARERGDLREKVA